MRRIARRYALALAVAGLMALGAESAMAGAPAATKAPAPPVGVAEMSLGSATAKVTVIEYASTTCPHCARWNAEVFPEFKRKYIDSGQVRYVFREFPTSPMEVAAAGFLIARCAPPAKYFDVIDALFRDQANMYENGVAGPTLLKGARAGGLSDAQAQTCAQDDAAMKLLNDRVQRSYEVDKIDSTPTFFVGDRKLSGEQTLTALDAVIQPLLRAR